MIRRLHDDPDTKDGDIRIDVKRLVVVLGGCSSWLAQRAADEDAWNTRGVLDVSNNLTIGSAGTD